MKYFFKRLQQYLCTHSEVLMRSGAKNKSGWDHYHSVKCRLCEKEWKALGRDLANRYGRAKDCTCIYGE